MDKMVLVTSYTDSEIKEAVTDFKAKITARLTESYPTVLVEWFDWAASDHLVVIRLTLNGGSRAYSWDFSEVEHVFVPTNGQLGIPIAGILDPERAFHSVRETIEKLMTMQSS